MYVPVFHEKGNNIPSLETFFGKIISNFVAHFFNLCIYNTTLSKNIHWIQQRFFHNYLLKRPLLVFEIEANFIWMIFCIFIKHFSNSCSLSIQPFELNQRFRMSFNQTVKNVIFRDLRFILNPKSNNILLSLPIISLKGF